jgi:hypothetical protein
MLGRFVAGRERRIFSKEGPPGKLGQPAGSEVRFLARGILAGRLFPVL